MIKRIMSVVSLIVAATIVMAGCTDRTDPSYYSSTESEYSKSMAKNPELVGCKSFDVGVGANSIKVVRCPNSTTSTTYPVGKTTETIITIDAAKAEMEKVQARDTLLNRLSPEEKELLGIK